MRSYLDVARATLGLAAIQYSAPTLNPGSTIVRAVDIQELRSGVK
ncbi:MAG TPA: hypothetical protein VLV78_08110 [Thermoanaerobaculia bacterium]|nr:hypothetical protein [Thermoanaerobaculia bacterium]